MKKRVKEAMGKELTFDYDDDTVDELDQELLALEADKAEDDDQLPGKQLTVGFYKKSFLTNDNF